MKQHVGNKPFTPEVVKGLEEAAGVGVVITPQQIDATVDRHISKVKAQLSEQRYKDNMQCAKSLPASLSLYCLHSSLWLANSACQFSTWTTAACETRQPACDCMAADGTILTAVQPSTPHQHKHC